MKIKNNQIIFGLLLATLTFFGCKKESVIKVSEITSFEQKNIESWLSTQKSNMPRRKKQIDSLSKNLRFDMMWTEKYNGLYLNIVPISDKLIFPNNNGKNITNYFVSLTNAESKIFQSVIVQYQPITKINGVGLKHGTISNIFSSKEVFEDCNVRIITILDGYLYEKNYKDNKLFSTVQLSKNSSNVNSTNSNHQNESSSMATRCYAYYWVTTYSDGSQTWDYLGTSCESNTNGEGGGCPPNMSCQLPEEMPEGGVGGEVDGYSITVDDVIINLSNPCLLGVVNSITTSTIKTQVSTLFTSTFVGASAPANISFTQNSNLTNPTTGLPMPALSTPNPSTHTWNIQLNPNYGTNVSTEFWASVIVHELTHSFMTLYFGNNPDFGTPYNQHNQMFTNNINQMSSFLVQNFGLSAQNANALALGGLDDYLKEKSNNNSNFINSFNSYAIQNYGVSLLDAESIRALFANGTNGTPCP